MPEFDLFHVVKEVPRTSTTRFIIAYGELNEEVYIALRAQRKEGDTWTDLPNRSLFKLELAPDIIEGLMEASVFDPASIPSEEMEGPDAQA